MFSAPKLNIVYGILHMKKFDKGLVFALKATTLVSASYATQTSMSVVSCEFDNA